MLLCMCSGAANLGRPLAADAAARPVGTVTRKLRTDEGDDAVTASGKRLRQANEVRVQGATDSKRPRRESEVAKAGAAGAEAQGVPMREATAVIVVSDDEGGDGAQQVPEQENAATHAVAGGVAVGPEVPLHEIVEQRVQAFAGGPPGQGKDHPDDDAAAGGVVEGLPAHGQDHAMEDVAGGTCLTPRVIGVGDVPGRGRCRCMLLDGNRMP